MMAVSAFQVRGILRGRWALAAVAAFALASAVVSLLGLESFRQLGLRSVGPAAVSLVNLALLLPTVQGLLLGALTVSSDRERGLLAMLSAFGASPLALAAASWLAVTVSAALSLGLGFGVSALVVAGNVPAEDLPIFGAIGLVMLAAAAAAAAIGVLVGALAGSRLQAALIAVAAWFVLAVGLDLVVVGLGVFLRIGEVGLLVAALANPLEAARLAALLLLDAGGTVLGPMGAYLLGRFGGPGSLALLLAALAAWSVVPLGLAARALGRRDL